MRYFFIAHKDNGKKKLLPPKTGFKPNKLKIGLEDLKKFYLNFSKDKVTAMLFAYREEAERYVNE